MRIRTAVSNIVSQTQSLRAIEKTKKEKEKKKRNDILLQFSFAFDLVTSLELSLLRIVHLLPFMKQKGEKDVRWGGGGSLISASEVAH